MQGTGIVDQTQTNASGYYVFLNVQPGSYVLTVENQGFKTARVTFDIAVNQTLTENLSLAVGALTETVSVTAQAALLQQSNKAYGNLSHSFRMVNRTYGGTIHEWPAGRYHQAHFHGPGAHVISRGSPYRLRRQRYRSEPRPVRRGRRRRGRGRDRYRRA